MQPSLPESVQLAVEERLRREMATGILPGLSVGVVQDQELVWFQAYGQADLSEKRVATRETLHRVASITKTLTATALLQLRDAGKLQLDDPLVEHLPEFSRVRVRVGKVTDVTLRRLMAHHSGLVGETPLPTWDALKFPTMPAILAALDQTEVVIPVNSAFKYSNLGYGLLGEVITRVSGQPYFDYVKQHLLQPLGMTRSRFEVAVADREQTATGYMSQLLNDQFLPAPYSPLNGESACGQLYSSVADLARWLALQFRTTPETAGPKPVVSPSTLAEMHRPQYLEPDWSIGYCLGWRAVRVGNQVYHGHGGGIHGFASQISFSKPHRIGVICLANVWPHPGVLPLSNDLMDILVAAKMAEPAPPPPVAPIPPAYQPLLGLYTAMPEIPLAVTWRGGKLRLDKTPLTKYWLHVPAELEPTENAHEFLVVGGRGAGERITFTCTSQGQGRQFTLGGFVYRQLTTTTTADEPC